MSDIMECVPPPATRWQPDPGPAHGDTRKWISALPSAPRDDSWNIPTALISCTHDLICICWPKRIINPAASTIALSDKNGAARAPLWLAETRANCFHLNWWSERDRTTLLTINIRVKTGSSFLCLPCTFNISRFRLSFKLYHFIVLFWRRWWEGIKERERERERRRGDEGMDLFPVVHCCQFVTSCAVEFTRSFSISTHSPLSLLPPPISPSHPSHC